LLELLVFVGEEQLALVKKLDYVRDCEDALLVEARLGRAEEEFAVVYHVVRNLLNIFEKNDLACLVCFLSLQLAFEY
jgi:hypothetical protein